MQLHSRAVYMRLFVCKLWRQKIILVTVFLTYVGRDSSVGIATSCGLDRPGIESRWGEIFRIVQTGPVAHPAAYRMGTGSYPGMERPGRGVDQPPNLAPRSKKE